MNASLDAFGEEAVHIIGQWTRHALPEIRRSALRCLHCPGAFAETAYAYVRRGLQDDDHACVVAALRVSSSYVAVLPSVQNDIGPFLQSSFRRCRWLAACVLAPVQQSDSVFSQLIDALKVDHSREYVEALSCFPLTDVRRRALLDVLEFARGLKDRYPLRPVSSVCHPGTVAYYLDHPSQPCVDQFIDTVAGLLGLGCGGDTERPTPPLTWHIAMNTNPSGEYVRLGFSLSDLRIDTFRPATCVRVIHIPSGIQATVECKEAGGSVYKTKEKAIGELISRLRDAGLPEAGKEQR